MARTRNLKPGFFKNEDLADLGPYAMILFEGLWCWADRKGVVENRPRMLKAEIMPYFDVDVPDLLSSLERKGFIVIYQVSGKSYILIPTFNTHQNPHQNEKDSEFPLPLDGTLPSVGSSNGAHTPGTECIGLREEERRIEGGKKKVVSTRPDSGRAKFVPPTIDDVATYCAERKNNISPQEFVDFYETNGWVQGKGKPIRDWRGAVRTWENRNRPPPATSRVATAEDGARWNPVDGGLGGGD